MTDPAPLALLPAGLRDLLPPDAAHEAAVAAALGSVFASHGYEPVKPPLVEFEDSLFAGIGAATAAATFRLMDPASRRMMGVRADLTPQIARIAAHRLARAPRPLRLSYAGDVLRVAGGQLRPEREFLQVGVELIGSDAAAADAEVILLAAEALTGVGVARLTVDLTQPTLVRAVCQGFGLDDAAMDAVRAALDRKDANAVAATGGAAAETLAALLRAAGAHPRATEALAAIALPEAARAARDRLVAVAGLVAEAAPERVLTVDPVEYRGFEYQTGVSFTLFGPGVRGDLGRGGRYAAAAGEPATGFTLFMDSVLRALPGPKRVPRLFLPHGAPHVEAARLRAEGWIVVAGLAPVADPIAEAARLGCGHVRVDGAVVALPA